MARSKRVDLFSMLCGMLAIPLATVSIYLRSIHVPGTGVVLGWLDTLGLVNGPALSVTSAPEMTETGYFSINDENALVLLVAISIALGLVAMAAALWAEYRRKPNLYFSAGYVCGALAIAQFRLLAGLIFFMAGIAVALVMRRQRKD